LVLVIPTSPFPLMKIRGLKRLVRLTLLHEGNVLANTLSLRLLLQDKRQVDLTRSTWDSPGDTEIAGCPLEFYYTPAGAVCQINLVFGLAQQLHIVSAPQHAGVFSPMSTTCCGV
jgi:hypothetical protein